MYPPREINKIRYTVYMFNESIQKELTLLPKNIRHAIETFNWTDVSERLIQKYRLHIDAIEIFKNQSIAVAVGLESVEDYQDILMSTMNINLETAKNLVEDANTLIFTELQKTAFSKTESSSLHDALKDEGILLVDENDTDHYTSVDMSPVRARDNKHTDTYIPKYKSVEVSSDVPTVDETPKIPTYHEPIEISDLAGITKHRTPYTHHESEKISDSNLGKALYTNVHISKGDTFNVSPTHESQIKEDGDFLKHISPE